MVEWAGGASRPLLALSRRIAPGIRMAYVPWGPELPAGFPPGGGPRNKALGELARALRPFLPRDAAFVRFDPPWLAAGDGAAPGPPFRRAAADIQPPDTVVVDLSPPALDILAAMKPKWRYNIGLAEKRGVSVSPAVEDLDASSEAGASWEAGDGAAPRDFGLFYGLMRETAGRDGIAVHGAEYYRALFEACACAGAGDSGAVPLRLRLYVARHEGDCLAAVVILFRGKQATYLYGASSNAKRNLMAPYALQWRAMLDAKAAGCDSYDLFGIPPDENPAHPMAGLYRFKTGFGGSARRRPGSWDYPCRPALYALFRAAESARKKLRDRRKRSR